jgi:hypothetical protein
MQDQNTIRMIDIGFLAIFMCIAVVYVLLFYMNYLFSILFFFGLPALFLSLRSPRAVLGSISFSFLLTVPLGIVIDYLAVFNLAWYAPRTMFSFRIFGLLPIEDFVYGFLFCYLVLLFYNHFIALQDHSILNKNFKYFLAIITFGLGIFIFVYEILQVRNMNIPYYFFIGSVFLVVTPLILFFSYYPKYVKKFILIIPYFFLLTFVFELTSLHLGLWIYPGDAFIGWITLIGYGFPLEEFLFMFILAAPVILALYEVFIVPDKN